MPDSRSATSRNVGLNGERFADSMRRVLANNPFYRAKYAAAGLTLDPTTALDHLSELPFTTKSEFVEDQAARPPFGTNLTFPISAYTRLHLTSGTTGHPLRWLDTPESWQWWLDCWKEVYRAAGVTPDDRVFVAFSFGPFIGFWTAFEAGQQLGCLMMTGGGLSTAQRLELLMEHSCTVLISTPTYALRLAEVAREEGRDLAASAIRLTVHAGEPGASIPSVRARLERVFGARCVDHAGATEVGAWGFGCGVEFRMHINESQFIAEVIDPASLAPASRSREGAQRGELVLTNLGRVGSPVIRYRTGDLVELVREPCTCGRDSAWLRGGVLGRIDDMVVVRGVNVFPSAIENIVRESAEIAEFEVAIEKRNEMAELLIRIEVDGAPGSAVAEALTERVYRRLNLRPSVQVVPPRSLPRYEAKAARFKR